MMNAPTTVTTRAPQPALVELDRMSPGERALRLQAAELTLRLQRKRDEARELERERDALVAAADRLAGKH